MAVFVSKQLKVPVISKLASDYSVGDTVKIPVNGANTDFLVVHQGNPSTTYYDSSCNGTWLLMNDCYLSSAWHSSAVNDFANSTIKSYLDSTFFNLLSASAKTAVKQVKIPYRPGSGESRTCNTGANGLSCKVFLLSGAEVGVRASDDTILPSNEGAKLNYFDQTDQESTKRIAKYNGAAIGWWLRSPDCYYGTYYSLFITTTGKLYYNRCTSIWGIRPCVIINSSTKFDSKTNIIL